MKILDGASNGTGAAFDLNTGGRTKKENLRTIFCYGTFDGATVTVQISVDGTNYVTVNNLSFTAAGALNMEARARYVRGVVAGGSASESITLVVH